MKKQKIRVKMHMDNVEEQPPSILFLSMFENAKYRGQEVLFEGREISVSDGYHTFEDLYEHRHILFIALCKFAKTINTETDHLIYPVWCSVLHSDGTKYDDWFILGIGKDKGKQITYHLPARFWNEVCEFAEVLEKAPEWDGHTPQDVLTRLKSL